MIFLTSSMYVGYLFLINRLNKFVLVILITEKLYLKKVVPNYPKLCPLNYI